MRGFFLVALILFPAAALVADAYLGGPRVPRVVGVEAVDSEQRQGTAGHALDDLLEVRVLGSDGAGVAGVRVVWSAGPQGGALSPVTSTTDDRGVASSGWTLGSLVGSLEARAIVTGIDDSAVTFAAVASPDRPASLLQIPSASADASNPDSVLLIVADAHGNVVPGVSVRWQSGRRGVVNSTITSDSGTIRIASANATDSLIASVDTIELIIAPITSPAVPVTWLERVTGVPPARVGHAVAYDPINGNAVLFGGAASTQLSDMWLWNSDGWSEARPAQMPPPRVDHAIAFDGAGIILFGGNSGFAVLDDLWLWDGARWTQLTVPRGPAGRSRHAMVRDVARGTVLLFGGAAGPSLAFGDTWAWDGSSWRQIASPLSPSPRVGHAMAYDPVRQRVVLFGGSSVGGAGGLLNDTWEWTGQGWARIPTPVTPPALNGHAMAYDIDRGRVILFGGMSDGGPVGGTWEYDGRSWTPQATANAPEPRSGSAMFFDPVGRLVMLYGGGGATRYSDTWEYRIP